MLPSVNSRWPNIQRCAALNCHHHVYRFAAFTASFLAASESHHSAPVSKHKLSDCLASSGTTNVFMLSFRLVYYNLTRRFREWIPFESRVCTVSLLRSEAGSCSGLCVYLFSVCIEWIMGRREGRNTSGSRWDYLLQIATRMFIESHLWEVPRIFFFLFILNIYCFQEVRRRCSYMLLIFRWISCILVFLVSQRCFPSQTQKQSHPKKNPKR